MLSRSGPLPVGRGWSFEVKWDGFRALVSTEDGLRVRSRRGFEGIVSKKLTSRYRPGERGWVKLKNPNYWRRDSEIEAMERSRERRQRRNSLPLASVRRG